MAALDFPASPSSGQKYSANGSTWEWNGSAWIKLATTSGPTDQVTTTNDTSTAVLYPVMVDGAGDNKELKLSTSKLKFDASAGGLTVTGTSGEVTAGVGNTALIVDGDARVLGILTVGSGTVKIDSAGVTATGVATFTNFKTGTTNVHNVGVEAAGINVLGADTPIGTGATVYNSGLIVSKSGGEYQGVVTASTFKGAVEGNVTGNINATTGTFSGDVSIGGALTYEDVKNVDAIGIITARAGIKVTGGNINIENAAPRIDLTDTGANSDFAITNTDGNFDVTDLTNTATRLRITSGGGILAGTQNPINSSTSKFQVAANDATGSAILARFSASSYSSYLDFYKSRHATLGSTTVVNTNDHLGALRFYGVDGSNSGYTTAAEIYGSCDGGSGSSGDMPGRITFHTRPDGAGEAMEERLRITSAGKVGINSTSPTYALEVDGGTQNTVIAVRSSDAKAAISFLDSTSGGYGRATIGGEGDSVYITSGAGVEKIRFGTGGGNASIGISTTLNMVTNSEVLAVRGYSSFKSNNQVRPALYIGNEGAVTDTANALILFNQSGANRGGIGYVPNTGELRFNNQYFMTFCTGSSNLGGSEKLRIDSSGFIKQKFTSNNSTTAEGLFINNLNNGTGNNASLILSNDSGERKKAAIALIDTGAYGAGDLVFALDGADSGNLHLTNDEKLRITSDGTIFINRDANGGRLYATGGNLYLQDGNGRQTFRVDAMASGTRTSVLTGGGCLSIGTANPGQPNVPGIHIESDESDDCRIAFVTTDKANTRIGYYGLSNRFGIDMHNGFQIRDAGQSYATRFLIDSVGCVTLNDCDRTANVKALRIKADNDTTSTASTDRTGSNSYKNSAIVIQKGISNGSLVAGLIDAWDGSIHGTSIGITYSSGRYHTSFGVNNDTNDRPVEIMTISGNKKVKIGGGIANIPADIGLEIGGDGATTEIRLKNSGSGTGASDGFAIQKWSNGNNYIYDYDSNNILFGTSNGSRTKMDTSGRWTFAPSGGSALTSGSTEIAMSIVNSGGTAVSGGAYPGIAFKSTGTGGGNGMSIVNFDGNWDLYTYSGSQQGLGFLHSNSSSSGNARMTIGDDGKVCLGTQVYNYLQTSRYCGTALHVAGGALSIGGKGSGTASYRAGVYTLGWYITQHANANFYHLKTDLWAGGSPHGNNEYIMGGFRIEGYSYSSPTGSSTAWIQFHNWNGAYPGLSVKQHYHNWDMNPAVYTSSDGYVVLRVNGGTYKGHVIDLIQHTNYGSRDINVSSTAYNNNSTHF